MRHGESPENVTRTLSCRKVDQPLTETGVGQAERAAAWMARRPIRYLYASPMRRASQTAGIVGRELGLTPVVTEALREVDCGELEGRNDTEAWELFQQVITGWFSGDVGACCPGGETGRQAQERFASFMDSLPLDGDVLAVGHGGIFAWGVMQVCFDLRPQKAWDLYLPNTGIVLVERAAEGFSCVKWGWNDHLEEKAIDDVPEELQEKDGSAPRRE